MKSITPQFELGKDAVEHFSAKSERRLMRLVASEVKVLPISGEMLRASIAEHLTTGNLQDIIVLFGKSYCLGDTAFAETECCVAAGAGS